MAASPLTEAAMDIDELTYTIIGAGLKVHAALGPGLLEKVYEKCLAVELRGRGLGVERQHPVPVHYQGLRIACGFRLDLLVEGAVPVEVKSVSVLGPIHMAQMLTYLRLLDCRVGLLMNFGQRRLMDGVRRVVNGYDPAEEGAEAGAGDRHPRR